MFSLEHTLLQLPCMLIHVAPAARFATTQLRLYVPPQPRASCCWREPTVAALLPTRTLARMHASHT